MPRSSVLVIAYFLFISLFAANVQAANFEMKPPAMLVGLHATAPGGQTFAGPVNFKVHLLEGDATTWQPPLLFTGVLLPVGRGWSVEFLGGVAFDPTNPSPIVSVRPMGVNKKFTFWATIEYYPLQGHMLYVDFNPTIAIGKMVSVGLESENWVVPMDDVWHLSVGPHVSAKIGSHVGVGATLFVATDNGDGGYLRPRFSFNLFF